MTHRHRALLALSIASALLITGCSSHNDTVAANNTAASAGTTTAEAAITPDPGPYEATLHRPYREADTFSSVTIIESTELGDNLPLPSEIDDTYTTSIGGEGITHLGRVDFYLGHDVHDIIEALGNRWQSGYVNAQTIGEGKESELALYQKVLRFDSPDTANEVLTAAAKAFTAEGPGAYERTTIPNSDPSITWLKSSGTTSTAYTAMTTDGEYLYVFDFEGRQATPEHMQRYTTKALPAFHEALSHAQTQKTSAGYGKVERIRNPDKQGLLRLVVSYADDDGERKGGWNMPAVMNKRQFLSSATIPLDKLPALEDAGVERIAVYRTWVVETRDAAAAERLYASLTEADSTDPTIEKISTPQNLPNTDCFRGPISDTMARQTCFQRYGRYIAIATETAGSTKDPGYEKLNTRLGQMMAAQYLIFQDAEGKDLTAE